MDGKDSSVGSAMAEGEGDRVGNCTSFGSSYWSKSPQSSPPSGELGIALVFLGGSVLVKLLRKLAMSAGSDLGASVFKALLVGGSSSKSPKPSSSLDSALVSI